MNRWVDSVGMFEVIFYMCRFFIVVMFLIVCIVLLMVVGFSLCGVVFRNI